jgi:DNA-binding NarL/FixJ family response regulator
VSDPEPTPRPIRIALLNDYDVILAGIRHMLAPYEDRVTVIEVSTGDRVHQPVDIALYDTFAQAETDRAEFGHLVNDPDVGKVAVYTWDFDPRLVEHARRRGISGYLSKTLPARELVPALEAVHAGEIVVSTPPGRAPAASGLDWPARGEGLTQREAEVLALVTRGRSNAEIAELTFLSPNTVKSYIRTIYRKIGVRRRTEAVLWGVAHGLAPDSKDRLLSR